MRFPNLFYPQERSLHFAIRPLVIAKFLSLLLFLFAGLSAIPMSVAFFTGKIGIGSIYIVEIILVLIVAFFGKKIKVSERLQRNEAFVILSLTFLIGSMLSAIPMMGYGLSFADAFFEAVSGITTTGLSTLNSVEAMPRGFLFARTWLQWVGGLGVVVLGLAMLIGPGLSSINLGFDKRELEDVGGGTKNHAKKILIVYSALTAIGIIFMWLAGETFFDSLTHTFAAVSTGGFSNYDNSLMGLNGAPGRIIVTLFCVFGAVPFYFYYGAYLKKKWWKVFDDIQLKTILLGGFICSGLIFVFFHLHAGSSYGFFEKAAHVLYTVFSAQTTAGFSTISIGDFGSASEALLILVMFVGGGLGSTAGGIKIIRAFIFFRLFHLTLMRISVPNTAKADLRVDQKNRVEQGELESIMAVILVTSIVLFVIWICFLAGGYDPLHSLFEVTSAIATVGLSSGVTSTELPDFYKYLLSFAMLCGRVETIAFIALLLPGTWFGRRRKSECEPHLSELVR